MAEKEEPKQKEEKKEEVNIEELRKAREIAEKLKEEYLASWQRARADLINYKKEEAQRLEEFMQYVTETLVEKFFPIADSFDLAKKHLTPEQLNDPGIQGLLMVRKMINEVFKNLGIEEISYLGKIYDPIYCEVLQEVGGTGAPSGTVVEELAPGFKTKDRILRTNRVKIAK